RSFFVFATLLALDIVARTDWLFTDGADGIFQHTHPKHGSRSIARPRDGRLFHDVSWNGAVRSLAFRRLRASNGGANNRSRGWRRVHRRRIHLPFSTAQDPSRR